MSYDRLYRPPPCSAWPAELLEVVGTIYREAAGQGLEAGECLDLARAGYLSAGGEPAKADLVIKSMIASLSQERGAWLWRPMDEWWAAHPGPEPDEAIPFAEAPW
ncbi:hypothetical protein ACFQX4_26825 [Roseomonas sp. GCM10028921]